MWVLVGHNGVDGGQYMVNVSRGTINPVIRTSSNSDRYLSKADIVSIVGGGGGGGISNTTPEVQQHKQVATKWDRTLFFT